MGFGLVPAVGLKLYNYARRLWVLSWLMQIVGYGACRI